MSLEEFIRVPFELARKRQEEHNARVVEKCLRGQLVSLCDVGAAGGLERRWQPYQDILGVCSFEPDARSSAENLVPKGVWKEETVVPLYLTQKPQCSSVFRPNDSYLELFPDSKRFKVIDRVEVSTTTIDKVFEGRALDFIKLDIQGAELAALQGAESKLSEVFGLEVEIEFKPIYLGQPLFSDIQKFCEAKGLEFIDFVHISRWERSQQRGLGECNFGDALFLRYPESVLKAFKKGIIHEGAVRRYAAILFIYGRSDLLRTLATGVEGILQADIGELSHLVSKKEARSLRMAKAMNAFLRVVHPTAKTHIIY